MDLDVSHWSANWPVLVGYLAVGGAHLIGLGRVLAGGALAPPRGPAARRSRYREAAVFQLGLLIAVLAVLSPIGYWSGVFVWVRAVQELMLGLVAPGLIVLGAPWAALRQCLPGQSGNWPARATGASDQPAHLPWLLAQPVAAVAAFNVVWLGWHIPVLFDLTRTNSAVAVAEHVTLLAAGVVFWLQLIGSRPWSPPSPALRRVALLVSTVIAGTVLGMVLVFGSGVLYPAYAGTAHHVMTVLDDQQLAGAVLWMGMLPPVISAAIALLMQWLSDEQSADLAMDPDRLFLQRKSSWPSRSGVR